MKNILTFLMLNLVLIGNAQPSECVACVDYSAQIRNVDVSKLWCTDTIVTPFRSDIITTSTGKDSVIFAMDTLLSPEPLGYIGDNYQRFYIHYISVVKSKDNPTKYYVNGKTKVKNKIHSFKGTITIIKAMLDTSYNHDYGKYKSGTITCKINFYEVSLQNASGFIQGELSTDFIVDERGKINYDAMDAVSDGFSNNQCTATWTSYKTGKSKKCNWGDFRIPDSGDLDIGAGGFIPHVKYEQNGWQNYRLAQGFSDNDEKTKKAQRIEEIEWWR
jgi:hypothetical protein